MSHRNLTELFHMLRNNAAHSRNVGYENNSDSETLLGSPGRASFQPRWIGKYDEANYLLFKIQERVDEVKKLQSAVVRAVLSDESAHNRGMMEAYMVEIKTLICTCHDNVRSLQKTVNGTEEMMVQNIQKHLLYALQGLTGQYRHLQTNKSLHRGMAQDDQLAEVHLVDDSTAASSSAASGNLGQRNSVETFDNFLQLQTDATDADDQQLLDDVFQLPATGLTINQKQIMLLQADNTKMLKSREDEVLRMTNSITDLNVIFKDISQLIQEQGTVLDRIDYNIESAQVRVNDGLRQLQKTEAFQRKNHKMHCISFLAVMIMIMIMLIVFTKL
ncbi:syntaxin-16 isoform X1 [Anopheles bellator]|uniref:syntaxin-16 isoform X1 n=1 Tax=Anopheles bellator TaxID=139047 RepID=UPI002649C905|nr:syntaxin-16 isoform X1 [Anopheles bellator]